MSKTQKTKMILAKCPVCGRKPRVRVGTEYYWVGCSSDRRHEIEISHKRSEADAVRFWNELFTPQKVNP